MRTFKTALAVATALLGFWTTGHPVVGGASDRASAVSATNTVAEADNGSEWG